jgi:multidrug efflux system membrane fusion protein
MPTDRSTLVPRLRLAGLIAGGCAALAVGWGVFARARDTHDLQIWTNQQAVPTVKTISPTAADGRQGLELPGSLQAFNEAPIYARVSGYLKSWNEDIGAKVRAGQLLAVIDAPELDQQLAEAKANLATVAANQKLARITAGRFTDLAADDAVSKQDADEKSGDLAAKSAAVQAARANVDRLQALEGFKRIVAPFDGVVTQRTANIGALVNAGAGSNPAAALFSVADVHKLRVYVQVPQSASAQIEAGETANLTLPQFPNRSFPARVVRDAGAVGQSGALLVELEVDNPDAGLKPGDFAQVRFSLPGQAGTVRVPASALIFRRHGLQVAVLRNDDRVHLQSVSVARDFGGQVELSGGVRATDRIVDNPPDSLEDGDVVKTAQAVPGAPHV